MALIDFKVLPGIDKQDTTSGAENRWIDCDNTRFRYGLPEKVGGWSSLISDTIVGVARRQFAFVDLDGNKYVAIGTDKFLLLYFEGQLFDITPIKSTIASVVMSAQDATQEVSLTFSSNHNLQSGDIILLDSVTVPSGIGLTDAAFEDKLFQVTRVTSSLIAIVTGTQTTTGAAGGGACSVIPYEPVGPAAQSYGYGFGIGQYGGTVQSPFTTTLNGALLADTNGTGGSGTVINVTSNAGLPTAGTIAVANELITYTGKGTNTITGITRGAFGTATAGTSNGQAHSNGATVTDASNFTGFGSAVQASQIILEPGLWSLSNFGQVLVATIANGKTFTWNAGAASPLTVRASTSTSGFSTSSNPTATRVTLVSPTTRHLIHLGTETTIGDITSQDDMFIRFSDQEDINDYTPTAVNTAGSQRLQDGTKIIGSLKAKETILVWTDNALYTMKFIGAPFTFGFEQVGTNCGLIGKNAAVEIDGVAFWMSNNGFFMFDGTVKSLPCSVEDYVYDQADTTKGQQICAGINNLFTEVVWYYPSTSSDFNDQYVAFNYGEAMKGGVWYIGTESRTTWIDASVYQKPFATKYISSSDGSFPVVVGQDSLGQTQFFEHEVGTDQVNPDGSTTIVKSFVKSYDFDIQSRQQNAQGKSTGPSISGETFLAMRRFVPDFKDLQGNAKVTLAVKRYPQQSDTTTSLSPFTINSSTDKKDTRARGRFVNIKIENTDVSESWRFGTLRIDIQPDGRR
jgi:hypothetical protein